MAAGIADVAVVTGNTADIDDLLNKTQSLFKFLLIDLKYILVVLQDCLKLYSKIAIHFYIIQHTQTIISVILFPLPYLEKNS